MSGQTPDRRTDRQNQSLNPAAAWVTTGGNDGLVGELFKYSGEEVATPLKVLILTEESFPKQWSQGLIISLYSKGDTEDLGNYRGIKLLRKLFCKILNNCSVIRLESERALYEGQAGFREKRCVDTG